MIDRGLKIQWNIERAVSRLTVMGSLCNVQIMETKQRYLLNFEWERSILVKLLKCNTFRNDKYSLTILYY